jgi:hypothetical protein
MKAKAQCMGHIIDIFGRKRKLNQDLDPIV